MLGTERRSKRGLIQSSFMRYLRSLRLFIILSHTVLEGVSDDDVGFIGLLENSTLRRAEKHHERLRSFDGWVLDVIHDGQTAGL